MIDTSKPWKDCPTCHGKGAAFLNGYDQSCPTCADAMRLVAEVRREELMCRHPKPLPCGHMAWAQGYVNGVCGCDICRELDKVRAEAWDAAMEEVSVAEYAGACPAPNPYRPKEKT